ncbi:hypothetical protein DMH01_15290 [Amycolatopsis sp. WAC 04182]|uniref:hypothetical protein n=1 Tax=Amycolatopsis sp. WAC 04182 TaxID=2203198 RepID=UPI000F7B2833|nr:hypothetical protein [Amycolatopsis sp. WAC 04182]RSN60653.1 hypothetical protein DMH01_15290 [Amycolatopsis sp. WAC 04182]
MSENEVLKIPFGDLDIAKERLRRGGSTVDGLHAEVPAMPEAGEFSGAAGAVLAHLLDATAQLAIGLGAVGDAVGAAAAAYREGDGAARDIVLQLWTN